MSRKRILFVDDEIEILEGLANLLRKQRKLWDMVFVLGGDAALVELARSPFDVIVSDMRMPGMDGRALLTQVKDRYPSVSRIVLSGHAERDAIAGVIPVAHRFLSKPCDVDTLQLVIVRACDLQGLVISPAIRDAIGRLDKLPSVPRSYRALQAALARPDVGVAEVSAIVQEDPAMCAKVLQLVNSAYFGDATRISSVQEAVTYIGVDLIRDLARTSHVFAMADDTAVGLSPGELEALQVRSLAVAQRARRLVMDPDRADEAFTAAMVRDVGEIVLAGGMPQAYAQARREARATHRPAHIVETERLGLNHAEVGAYLLGIWGIPFSIVDAVAHHHDARPPAMAPDVARALQLAGAAVDERGERWAALDRELPTENGYTTEAPLGERHPCPGSPARAATAEG